MNNMFRLRKRMRSWEMNFMKEWSKDDDVEGKIKQ